MAAFAAVMVIGILCLSDAAPRSLAASSIQLVDSTTAQSVDSSTNQPINRSQTFSTSDSAVYSWVELGSIPSPSHNVTWVWLGPGNERYYEASFMIPDPGSGTTWKSYYVWSSIYVQGHRAAQMQGLWEVDVYVDGAYFAYQLFTIATSAVPIQPAEGFSWPSTTIPVFIGTAPSNVVADVKKAMLQWDYSQGWFQGNYGLQQRPVFNLVPSNDSSSPVKVTFNQTQTSSNWGWTSYHYYYSGTGEFTSVTCSVSIVLTLSDGTPLNDVAMQDISEHELGHCLGLGHTAQSTDLMNHFGGSFTAIRLPSTLNLYALYQLAGAQQASQVASYYYLPGPISYGLSPSYPGTSTTTTITTSLTTSSASSTTITSTATSESSQSTSRTTTTPATTSASTTSSGGGIPEFPSAILMATVFTAVMALAYFAARRTISANRTRQELP